MTIWLLTRPCGRQSRGPRHRDFEPGCSRSTRGTRRRSPRWDSRWGSFVPSRTGRYRDPCSGRSRNRRRSGGRFAVFPPVGSHLFVSGSRSGFERRQGRGKGIGTRVRDRVEMCAVDVFFCQISVSMWWEYFLNVFFMTCRLVWRVMGMRRRGVKRERAREKEHKRRS